MKKIIKPFLFILTIIFIIAAAIFEFKAIENKEYEFYFYPFLAVSWSCMIINSLIKK